MEAHIRITWVLILYSYANTYMSTHASLTKKGVIFLLLADMLIFLFSFVKLTYKVGK